MKKLITPCLLLAAAMTGYSQNYTHPVQAEKLNRGAVAVKTDGGVFISWRSLISDDASMTYDVYRDGAKINDKPITKATNYTDQSGAAGATYEVKCLVDGIEVDSQSVQAWESIYKKVHLDRPDGGTSPAGGSNEMRDYTYTPDDVSVGDVDADGEYELIVKWHPTNQADNSFRRYTGNTYIDCYKMDGTKLWRIDLGINIRSGNHYTQFMVYDFDGDGHAEMMCKTAPGTIDGQGKYVVMDGDDPEADYRSTGTNSGIILSGPEYLTVFDGQTGAEISTIAYNPPRNIHPINKSNWGDDYGNRCERYLACVAYLDGEHASGVFCRGYYTYSYLWAVDFDGKQLKERWLHTSDTKGKGAYGEGAHAITVGDVDADGKDEIIYGSACIDDDGSLMYRTGAGHGDALHLAAMLPDRQGLQVFMPHEEKSSAYLWDADMHDAMTGEILYGNPQSGNDNGRGLAANISSNWPGYEYWSSVHRNPQNQGVDVGSKSPSINFRVYWDGDLLDELLDGTTITKPNNSLTSISTLVQFSGYSKAGSCNDTKKTPNLQADILGDWREEVILHDTSTESDLLIFTTPIPTDYKVATLMQDRQYRLAVAWQNVAYNQPPHLGYNLEELFNVSGAIAVTEGNANQVVNVGEQMQTVAFAVKRATGIKTVTSPAWMHIDFDSSTLQGTITGKPDAEGEFTYRIETTGAADGNEGVLEGTIIAHRNEELTLIAQLPFETVAESTPNVIYGEAVAYNGAGETVDGKKGNALRLNGNNYYVQDAYEGLDFGDRDFTIEMWVRTADDTAYLLHKGSTAKNASTGATGNWVGIEIKNGTLKFAVDDDVTKTGIDVTNASQWLDNEWHQIVLVRDRYAKMLYAYVDGKSVGETNDLTGAINCADEALVIGNVNVSFNNTLKGDIDQLSIYRGAMSAAKVLEHHQSIGNELAYFPMDQLSESTPNMVYGEAVTVGAGLELVNGLKGGAIKFNNSAYLKQQAYEAVQMGDNDFTIHLWMKSDDSDGYIFFKGSHAANASAGTTGHWIGIERKNGYLTFTIDDDVTKTDCKLADANAYFDGNWHHICAVRDFAAKTMRLYVDGKQVASAANVKTGALNDNLEDMMIGNSDEGTRQFAGVIDELIILPKAMSADEVEAAYAELKDVTGITDIVTDSDANARYIIVDAMSGIIMRQSIGSYRTDDLGNGVYILVIKRGDKTEAYKIVR